MKEQLHIRLSKEEMDKLRAYAESTQRTQTDIIREFLRSLPDACTGDLARAIAEKNEAMSAFAGVARLIFSDALYQA